MKIKLLSLVFICTLLSCKNDNEQATTESNTTVELSEAEKIAQAHGIDHWNDVEHIAFTFNVDRDSSHFERSWTWKPKTDAVTMTTANDTVQFNRASVDSTSLNADKGFINDKFWLLAPYQLVWDEGTTLSEPVKAEAPMSKKEMNMISITYGDQGGYTPGDAYDFYYGDDYLIKEWVFRKGNAAEPSMVTTFENYEDFGGLKIAKDHTRPDGNWKLYFTDVKVEK